MALNVTINSQNVIGRAAIRQATRSTIASQNFSPKPNVSLSEVSGVSTTGVQDGYTLIFNSDTNKFEAQPIADLTATITQINGGTF